MHRHQTIVAVSVILASFVFYECSENNNFEFFDDGERSWPLPYETLTTRSSGAAATVVIPTDVINERTISVEFSPRRRRFPFLKAVVRHIVSPERRGLDVDLASHINHVSDRPVLDRLSRRPKIEIKEISRGVPSIPIDTLALEMMSDTSLDDNNNLEAALAPDGMMYSPFEERRPVRKRGLFLIKVLSRIFRSVNVTAVSTISKSVHTCRAKPQSSLCALIFNHINHAE